MSYKELQEKAKALGLPHVGVSREDLEVAIAEAGKQVILPVKEPENATLSIGTQETPNAAVVYGKDGREVRTYTLETHGKGFEDLATEFSTSRGFRYEFKTVKPGIKCPACGHRFHP